MTNQQGLQIFLLYSSKQRTEKLEEDDTGVRTTVENFLQTNITMREGKKTSLKRRPLFDLVCRKVKRMISGCQLLGMKRHTAARVQPPAKCVCADTRHHQSPTCHACCANTPWNGNGDGGLEPNSIVLYYGRVQLFMCKIFTKESY